MATHLITGAGSGIGEAVARRLLERGDELYLLARDAGRAKELAERFPGARTLVADLANPDRLSWALSHQSLPERIDSLLHIAGVADLGPVGELTTKTWNRTLAVNLVAPAELTRLVLPQLRVSKGQVVFVNSGSGLNANADWAAYAASKHGLKALADSLRAEEHAARRAGDERLPGPHRHRHAGEGAPAGGQGVPAGEVDRPRLGGGDRAARDRPAAGRGDPRPDRPAGVGGGALTHPSRTLPG
ncbi:hypothetical protein GCM10020000_24110 [Streptomyces olivoverticillatus]